MRIRLALLALLVAPAVLGAQAPPRFPPDSLINVHVFPKTTPVTQVLAAMREFSGALGVRCNYCHVGEEGRPLETFNFASDDKRTKHVGRQMMRMTQEINRRLDTLPGRTGAGLQVTCTAGAGRPGMVSRRRLISCTMRIICRPTSFVRLSSDAKLKVSSGRPSSPT